MNSLQAMPSRCGRAQSGTFEQFFAEPAGALHFLDGMTQEQIIDQMLAVNLRAPLLLVAAFIPSMIERGGGSIINVSSVSGLIGTPQRAAYAASW